jgi:endonuclease/exonuclease/phosphatase family metal-dependent hydrolase
MARWVAGLVSLAVGLTVTATEGTGLTAAEGEQPRIGVLRFTAGSGNMEPAADQLTALLCWRLRESGKFEVLAEIPLQGEAGLQTWAAQNPKRGDRLPQLVLIPYVMMDDGYFHAMVVSADPWSDARPATHIVEGSGGLADLVRGVNELAQRLSNEPALTRLSDREGATGAPEGLTAPSAIKLTERMQAYRGEKAGIMTSTFVDRFDPRTVRLVSYNVNWDKIFPDVDARCAEKFQRVVKALDADVWCLQEIRDRSAEDVRDLMNAINPLAGGASWHAHKGWSNVIVSKFPLKLTADRTVPAGERELAMALVDLPNDRFKTDLYVLNNHWKCCGDTANDPQRQQMADAIVNWIRDARVSGGAVDVPAGTAFVICGDLNIVGGPQPVTTLLTGDIIDEARYGRDGPPDWDDTPLADLHPRHNADGSDDYTWRNDNDKWPPGRLDYIVYSDSVLEAVHKYVLNTTAMPENLLRKTRLEPFDIALDDVGREYDHLPLVVDFRVRE